MSGRVGRAFAATTAGLLAALPRTSLACAVCFSATEQNRQAFLGTTIFLSLLPLTMIGSVAFVVWRRSQALGEEAR